MSGLEQMMQRIEDGAKAQAAEIAAKAQAEAAALQSEANAAGAAASAEIAQRTEREVASYRDRAKSSLEQQRRTALLSAKQDLIASVLHKAYAQLLQMPDEAYFVFLKKMLQKFALPEAGQICFSRRDLARMPAAFSQEIQAIAQENGGSLTLSPETREVDGGFVLIYGGIEENCTFRALFDARKEALQDLTHQLLFT